MLYLEQACGLLVVPGGHLGATWGPPGVHGPRVGDPWSKECPAASRQRLVKSLLAYIIMLFTVNGHVEGKHRSLRKQLACTNCFSDVCRHLDGSLCFFPSSFLNSSIALCP